MSATSTISGVQRAAILLTTINRQLAKDLLRQLSAEDVESVSIEMARLGGVDSSTRAEVLHEFQGEFVQEPVTSSPANEYREAPNSLGEIPSTRNEPFSFLHRLSGGQIAALMTDEHPQAMALVMSFLPPALAADFLRRLSKDLQLDVARRVASLDVARPDVIHDVEQNLLVRMEVGLQPADIAGGIPRLAQILNVSDRQTNREILGALEQKDSQLVDQLHGMLFAFEELNRLDAQSFKQVIAEVDPNQWCTALKGASEGIVDYVLEHMDNEEARLLREEIEHLGPVRVSDVEAMQQSIVDVVLQLEEAGRIVVHGRAKTI